MRYVDALLCVVLLVVAEWLVVGLAAAGELAGGYELVTAWTTLVPLAICAALPLALGGAGVAAALDAEPTAGARRRWLLALPAALLVAGVGAGVLGRRLLEGVAGPAAITVVAALAAALGWFAAPWLARASRALRQRGQGWLVAATALVVTALELVNRFALPRSYAAFHVGLAVLTLWCAGAAAAAFASLGHARLRRWGAVALIGVCAFAAVRAPARLRLYDNLRLVFVEHAPILSHASALASLISPPPPMEAATAAVAGRPSIDLAGRDVLLVTIGALRADHVGAYGYGRDVTPELDSLAAEGAVFEAAYSPTPHTSYAITSLMTGKYMRPLLLQGAGTDSDTLAVELARSGYRTAGFYPPGVFLVDRERFEAFAEAGLGFEYRKVQPSSAAARADELSAYLAEQPAEQPVFLWVHLVEPEEPYEKNLEHDFGDHAVDRYDAEIAAADAGFGEIVRAVRSVRPHALVIATADHGEEFGDHGGRYHGNTVYDEQVRVPLVFHAPGLIAARRIAEPVGLVDVLPTLLGGVGVPASPRVRGRDLGPLLLGVEAAAGSAFSETEEQTLLAEGTLRLICARRVAGCRLFDSAADASEREDAAAMNMEAFGAMKGRLAALVSSLGRFEAAEASWPRALRRGLGGDVDAASDVADLLGDADVRVRRKAAEVLFELHEPDTAPKLRRALRSDDDDLARRWCALALTRLGEGAPLTFDLLLDKDVHWRRLAALTLAEQGDARGEGVLIGWWRSAFPEKAAARPKETIPFERAREVVAALARIKSEDALGPLTWALRDARLRPFVAQALAAIGSDFARPALAEALAVERHQHAREAIARAIVQLGGGGEMVVSLTRFMGVPDPIDGALGMALRADVLQFIGGPRKSELRRLRRFATSGVAIGLVVPEGERTTGGLRAVVRARAMGDGEGEVHFGLVPIAYAVDGDSSHDVPKIAPTLDPLLSVTLRFDPGDEFSEHYADLPEEVGKRVQPGEFGAFVVYATQNVEVNACAVVPLAQELDARDAPPAHD